MEEGISESALNGQSNLGTNSIGTLLTLLSLLKYIKFIVILVVSIVVSIEFSPLCTIELTIKAGFLFILI